MVKMQDNYGASKTKLVSCCRMIMTAIIGFSFLGLAVVGEISVAAGSISTPQIGGQELEEEEQQLTPESCGGSGGISVNDRTNASITTGIAGANNTATSLYENPEYGIQILCPENWVYLEEEGPFTGDFQVTFMSITEALEFGTALESEVTLEVAPIVGVLISEVPSGNLDLRLFADLNIEDLTSSGYEIVSSSLNATLSGMPAWEVVYVDPNRTMFLQDWTIQGDRAYAVMYVSHESRFNQFLPIAQDMISSFIITNDTRSTAPTSPAGNNGNTTNTAPGPNTSTTTQSRASSGSPSTISSTSIDNNNQATSLEAAKERYLTVWNQTEFQIAFNTFIEPDSATGYGIYEEHGTNNIFRPGETIELYLEPIAFGHQQALDENGSSLYLMNLTADIILSDVDGNEVLTFEDVPVGNLISHRQNTEMHVTLTVTQTEPFPLGNYIISYIVHDQVKGESFQIDERITIADDEGDASIGTIQREQQQQQEMEWLLYENATYAVRMLYPSTWTQQDTAVGDDRFILVSDFFSPEEAEGYFASVTIGLDNMPPSTNLEANLNESIDNSMQDPAVRDFQVLSSSTEDFTLAGMPAYSFESSYTDPEFGPQYVLTVETVVDNKGYSIQYFADAPIYEKYLPIVERMIESFEIMQEQ
jgi:hypothetical protein